MSSASGPASGSGSGVDWPTVFERYGFDTPDAAGNWGASPTQLRSILDVESAGWADVERAVDEGVLEEVRRRRETYPGSEEFIERTTAYRCFDIEVQE